MANDLLRTPADPAMPALLVDDREACRLLGGVSAKTLTNWRHQRGLPSVKIGGRRLYDPAKLRDWIDAQAD